MASYHILQILRIPDTLCTMSPEQPSINASPEQTQQEKEGRWQEALHTVDQLKDRLGLGVDEGIKETVAAFHVFEIHTTASHEGKLDRYPIPYIDVESPDTERLEKRLKDLGSASEVEAAEVESVQEEIRRKNLEERKKIIPLLEEFYTERKVPYDIRLNIRDLARGWSRIQSQGAAFQEIEQDEEVKKQKLQQFQEEMRAFTEFLKDKYFASK